jgi:hypothetical protein
MQLKSVALNAIISWAKFIVIFEVALHVGWQMLWYEKFANRLLGRPNGADVVPKTQIPICGQTLVTPTPMVVVSIVPLVPPEYGWTPRLAMAASQAA